VTVDVIKQKQVNIIVVTAVLERINLKMVPLIAFPAMLACINLKKHNLCVKIVQKTITPTNPNKLCVKRVWARKKRRIQVLPFVSHVMLANTCQPIKYAHIVT